MKKYRPILLILSSVCLLITVACGQKDLIPTNQNDSSKNLTTIKIIAESPEAITLFKAEEKNIEDKFGIKLEYHYPDRITDRLEDFLFATNEQFDIYIIFPVKIPLYTERDMLIPLDDYMKQIPSFEKEIVPVYRQFYMNYDDHDYGVVYDGDARLLFYRKDLFTKYNEEYKQKYGTDLAPPKTWQEYEQIAKFLTRDTDGDGQIDLYGTASLNADAKRYIWFSERLLSMGGAFFDSETMEPLIDSQKGITAVRDEIALQDSGATPPKSMYDWVDLNNAFFQGELAMVLQWSDTARFSYDKKTWNSKVIGDVDWTIVPSYRDDTPKGGTWIGRVLSISRDTKYPDKAWEVIQYVTSKDVSKQAINSNETINDPYLYEHFKVNGKGPFPDQETNESFLTTLQQSLEQANADLMIPGSWEYMQVLDKNLGLALLHKLTPEQALQQSAEEWEKITEHYGRENQKEHYQSWLEKFESVKKASNSQ